MSAVNGFQRWKAELTGTIKEQRLPEENFMKAAGRLWKEVPSASKLKYSLEAAEANETTVTTRSAFYRKQIKDADRQGTRKAACIHCEELYTVFVKSKKPEEVVNALDVKCITSNLFGSCASLSGLQSLVAGALLDRGNKDYSGYFSRGQKRDSDRNIIAQEFDFLSDDFKSATPSQKPDLGDGDSTDFDPISLAASEALPAGITCACGEKIKESSDLVQVYRAHIVGECSFFEELRKLLFSMILPEESVESPLLPGLVELYPFTAQSPKEDNDDDSVFYLHWLKNVPLLWRNLFLKKNFSYGGIIHKIKGLARNNGFTARRTKHVSARTINLEKEEMIALTKGNLLANRILEGLTTALLNNTECLSKNARVEPLPLIGLSKAELRRATSCLIYLFGRFADSCIAEMDPEQLRAARIAYHDAERVKLESLLESLNLDE